MKKIIDNSRRDSLSNTMSNRKRRTSYFDSFNKGINSPNPLNKSSNISKRIEEILSKHRNINKLYDWQIECLKIPGVGTSRNLLYSLPTSGGKTLVAEILMFKQLVLRQKSVIFVLPFISLVQEKVKSLSPIGLDLDFLVEEYASNKGKYPPTKHRNKPSIYVATIEKAHSLINSLIEIKQTERIGLLVVDELHMIGDGTKRGANLELCLLKFMQVFKNVRIIGMSATLDNLDEMSKFLDAELFVSEFRPVILNEYVKVGEDIYKIDNTKKEFIGERKLKFQVGKATQSMDPDNVIGLISEVLPEKSCLIFCPTKKQCENLTNNIIKLANSRLLCPDNKIEKRDELLKLLKVECISVCPILQKSIKMGVAYHHSGLTQEERKIVEEGFLDGTISIICCTSTLAAGVNLPARRVIIRSPYIAKDFIKYSQYKQMTGRAGRAGYDTEGESFVILPDKEQEKFGELILQSSSKCQSSLLADNCKMIKHFVLSTISLELVKTFEDILNFLKISLFNIQNPGEIEDVLKQEIQYLMDNTLIKQVKSDGDDNIYVLKSTELGRAVVRGGIDVSRAGDIYKELKEAEKCLNLSTYLQLLYIVTPHDMIEAIPPDWNIYSRRVNQLTPEDRLFFEKFGLNEEYFWIKSIGRHSRKIDDGTSKRLYLSLILYDLWNQAPTYIVAENYSLPRGQIQMLLQSAVTLSACLSNFVEEFRTEFWGFKELLPKFTTRLSYCVSPELIPLMEIDGVKKGRAIALFKSGYDTVLKVASSDSKIIYDTLKPVSRKVVTEIISSAKMIIQERLECLTEEVKDLIVFEENQLDEEKENLIHSTPIKNKDSDSFTDSVLFSDFDSLFSD